MNRGAATTTLQAFKLLSHRGITHYPVMHREVSQLVSEYAERMEDVKP